VSTTSPPSPPLRDPLPPGGPSGPGGPPGPGGRGGTGPAQPGGGRVGPSRLPRILAVGGLLVVVAILVYLLVAPAGGNTYYLEFENANQLVRGNEVQVGGVPVGSISNIALTSNYRARVTVHVNTPIAPLHEGTTAQIRVPSLGGVAGRYIALTPGPNNSPTLPNGYTFTGKSVQGTTDIDELFNTLNPRTRKGLQEFFQGNAEWYVGLAHEAGESSEYFAPALASADRVFAELSREQHTFTEFLVQGAKTVTTIAARAPQLAGFVEHADTAFGALGAQQNDLASGVEALPKALHAGNVALAEAPATFAALRRLAEVSKPGTAELAAFFARLRPLLTEATPVLHNLSVVVTQPGPNNDLTDIALGYPALARELAAATPNAVKGLENGTTFFSRLRPYTPDLVGFARSLGQSTAGYDANGHYIRATTTVPSFALGSEGSLTPASGLPQGLANLKTGQLLRCPGSATPPPADGSAPFTDTGQLECNPAEVP
jgi:phospholipid/cholesterol/gamma-HCH transport system substrate-binding protein